MSEGVGYKGQSSASKDARTIPFGSGNTESGSVNAEPYNPFTKDGKTKPGDRTPTSASQRSGG